METRTWYGLLAGMLALGLSVGCSSDEQGAGGSGTATGTDAVSGSDADTASTGGDDGGSTTGVDGATDAAPDSSPEDDGGADGDAGSLTAREAFDQVFDLVFEGFCSAIYECPQKVSPGLLAAASRFGSSSACSDEFFESASLNLNEQFQRIQSDIDEGLTRFDEQAARSCLQTLRSRVENGACSNLRILNGIPQVCRQMFEGTRAQGEPCAQDRHCTTLQCDTSANPGECHGVCGPAPEYVEQGNTCDSDSKRCRLGDDLICATASSGTSRRCREIGSLSMGDSCSEPLLCGSGLNCVGGTCQNITVKSQGESCDALESRCKAGLVCAVRVSGSGNSESVSSTCTSPVGLGGSCYRQLSCENGLYCKGGKLQPSSSSDSVEGTCEKRLAEGQSCGSDEACQSDNCDQGTCKKTTTSTCDVPPAGG